MIFVYGRIVSTVWKPMTIALSAEITYKPDEVAILSCIIHNYFE